MKIRFKKQHYQTLAVDAVVDCFQGQPFFNQTQYKVDPGLDDPTAQALLGFEDILGFRNAEFGLSHAGILKNIQEIQKQQRLNVSPKLESTPSSKVNLDIEMETGTGKTYCYIKTMFELNKRYGWSKFIVMVPSIAIREGVYKSFEMTKDHFLEEYGKQARFFIYNSKELAALDSFSTDAGINVMIINVQAFNATGKDNRRIYEELDDFQSRRPIDVISSNRPILILDEPQKMEGKKTSEALAKFNALMVLRYSATHATQHNRIHRLDALDAYNQKLVKKISVRGISVSGLSGTNAYLYFDSIQTSKESPVARVELEVKQKNGIKRVIRKVRKNDNLFELSNSLEQYKGFTVADIEERENRISFANGVELTGGTVTGDDNETALRRIQIRETIRAHFEKERYLHGKGIKVLSLFFIDEVAKYRQYDEEGEVAGDYAKFFEEEYDAVKNDFLTLFKEDQEYVRYVNGIDATKTHNGYFSIDKKSKQLKDPKVKTRGEMKGEADDVDAYELILKDKERLLSFEEPVRFIFSHSALREGWDNPNVFVICTLKHSDNTTTRRQEVGRGMRLCVNQQGDRIDDPGIVHDVNVLTIVANESYQEFVSSLQSEIREGLSSRPRHATQEYFKGQRLETPSGETLEIDTKLAKLLYRYLLKNDYSDEGDNITQIYHDAKDENELAPLPPELQPYQESVISLIDSVYSDASLIEIQDDRAGRFNRLSSSNFEKVEFQRLWERINRKAIYAVDFDSSELIPKCVEALNRELKVAPLQYTLVEGQQVESSDYDSLEKGEAFKIQKTQTLKAEQLSHYSVRYDLVGKVVEETSLTRRTIAAILSEISEKTFEYFRINPEEFMANAARLINEQKATAIIEHLSYDPVEERYSSDIFTAEHVKANFSKAVKVENHVYDYVCYDSENEKHFAESLDASVEVTVYAKLPRSFFIPTPVGAYNPDWAIAFKDGSVKHLFFIAETKGSMSSMELRKIEESKIECARKFFATISEEQVKYDVVDSYGKMMELLA